MRGVRAKGRVRAAVCGGRSGGGCGGDVGGGGGCGSECPVAEVEAVMAVATEDTMATRAVVPVAGGGGGAEARGRRRGNGGQRFTNPAARVHACPPGGAAGRTRNGTHSPGIRP